VANGTSNAPQPSICNRRSNPAKPDAAGRLRLLLSQPAADLQAITSAIENDLDLTIRLLQCAWEQPGLVPPGTSDIGEIVVHLGLQKLKAQISKNAPQRAKSRVSH